MIFTKNIKKKRSFFFSAMIVAVVALFVVFFWRLLSGDMDLSFLHVMGSLLGIDSGLGDQGNVVVCDIRLPRVLASMGSGATLALSGLILQALLSNPLAEPYTLGLSSGAALGASIAIIFGWYVSPVSFIGALLSLVLVAILAWKTGGAPGNTVLAGIVVGASLSAGVTLVKALAGENVAGIVFWLMGSFSGASWWNVYFIWGSLAIGSLAWFLSGDLDAISLGGNNPSILGVEERRIRCLLFFSSALSTAAVVSSFGVIGFVGLVVPHLLRLIVGASHRELIPLSLLYGALLLALADGIARNMGELPVGVLTSLVGGPFFCWILVKERGRS